MLYDSENQDSFDTLVEAPAHLVAADNHNIAADQPSMLESASSYVQASFIAGGNSLYNTALEIGNVFGADNEESKTRDVIEAYDSDLVKYYDDHQDAVEAGGFVLGSILPGMAGVKAFNYGQKALKLAATEGRFGEGFGKALALKISPRDDMVKAVASNFTTTGNPFTLLNANVMKAAAAGSAQQAAEWGVFEAAADLAMSGSPILEQQDFGDITTNILHSAALGGILGGILTGAKLTYGVKKAISAADREKAPFKFQPLAEQEGITPDKQLYWGLREQDRIAQELSNIDPSHELAKAFESTGQDNLRTIQDHIRSQIGVLANGDQEAAEAFSKILDAQPDLESKLFQATNVVSVSRLGNVTKLEAEMAAARIKDPMATPTHTITYTVGHGPRAGNQYFAKPEVTNLADRLGTGESIEINTKGVKVGADLKYTFSPEVSIDIAKGIDHYQAEARYLFAQNLEKPLNPKMHFHENDIPFLEKLAKDIAEEKLPAGVQSAYRNGITIVKEDGTRDLLLPSQIKGFVEDQKIAIANKLIKSNQTDALETIVTRVGNALGIDFQIDNWLGKYAPYWGRFAPKGLRDIDPKYSKAIGISEAALRELTLQRLSGTLLHERGHELTHPAFWNQAVNSLSAADQIALRKELVAASRKTRPESWKELSQLKGPEKKRLGEYLNNMDELLADGHAYFAKNYSEMATLAPTFEKAFGQNVIAVDIKSIGDSVLKGAERLSTDSIGKIVNVHPDYLEGIHLGPKEEALYAMQTAGIDNYFKPSVLKTVAERQPYAGMSSFVADGMVAIQQIARTNKITANNLLSSFIKTPAADHFPEISRKEMITSTTTAGTGQGAFTSVDGNYGSVVSKLTLIGKKVQEFATQKIKDWTEVFEPHLYKLANNPDLARRWEVLHQATRGTADKYILDLENGRLVKQAQLDWEFKTAAASEEIQNAKTLIQRDKAKIKLQRLQDEGPAFQDTKSLAEHVLDEDLLPIAKAYQSHIDWMNGYKAQANRFLGKSDIVDQNKYWYPLPVSQKDTPYFAHVVDRSLTGNNHGQMIYAASEQELAEQIAALKENFPAFEIYTKAETERYYKAIGEFDYSKTINESQIDAALKRLGKSSSIIPLTDPKRIVEKWSDFYTQQTRNLTRRMVETKYFQEMAELESQAAHYEQLATSKPKGLFNRFTEQAVQNPYRDLKKLMLGIAPTERYGFLNGVNSLVDQGFGAVVKKVKDTFGDKAITTEEELDRLAEIHDQFGISVGFKHAAEVNLANSKQLTGEAAKWINRANAIVTNLALRTDPMNALNGVFGLPVLTGTEMQSVLGRIGKLGSEEAIGKLNSLAYLTLDESQKRILSPHKLFASSIDRFFNDPAARQWVKDNGFGQRLIDLHRETIDNLANGFRDISGDGAKEGLRKASKAMEALEKYSGNTISEEFQRFIAADSMKQLTDILVDSGKMSKAEQLTYVNTFVNRTQGNYIAAQRPFMFQGPVGQAIGLFQTYSFNMLQQLLRHVGEGGTKNAALMMGLQSTIYGMNGLPAFNAINTHLVGNAAGNTGHKDIIGLTYEGLGKQMGDLLTYGLASNGMGLGLAFPELKLNMYTRGDLSPRNMTVLPVNPADLPFVQATGKMLGAFIDTGSKIVNGADVSTALLTGVEHAFASRPLTGIAQAVRSITDGTGQVYSTDNAGQLVASHDLLSITTLGKIAGAKPLEESYLTDAMFRIKAYQAHDSARRHELGEVVRNKLIAGQDPNRLDYDKFLHEYTKAGGKQKEFNHWVMQNYKTANKSKINDLYEKLSGQYEQSMQSLMGGYYIKDFYNSDSLE